MANAASSDAPPPRQRRGRPAPAPTGFDLRLVACGCAGVATAAAALLGVAVNAFSAAQLLCAVVSAASAVQCFRGGSNMFAGMFRCCAVVLSLLVAVLEPEWGSLIRFCKIFEYWPTRGMLQIFVAVMTKVYPSIERNDLILLQEIASYMLLACRAVYVISVHTTPIMVPPPPPSPPVALPEELIEEILIRFPHNGPASLLHAALVCKSWCRLISGPSFRRRFCELHRTPPMMGFLCNNHFVPTTTFCPPPGKHFYRYALDARHGRVLLCDSCALVVWDPITDTEWKVPFPPQNMVPLYFTAAVLCSAASAGSCDHLDCHRRSFIVVYVASVYMDPEADAHAATFVYTYSSDAAAWSEPTCGQRHSYFVNPNIRSALVGNMLYFGNLVDSSTALKYNMQLRQMSWIELPSSFPLHWLSALTTTEDGGLRFAVEHEYKLYIWSTKDADEVDTRWEQNRVIELNMLLPADADLTKLAVVGSTDDLSTIFVNVDNAAYAIDLKTFKVKKVYEGTVYTNIVPYVNFYTPALETAGTCEEPSTGGWWLKCVKSLRCSCEVLKQVARGLW